MMSEYLYFLPKTFRGKVNGSDSDGAVKIMEPAFSSLLDCSGVCSMMVPHNGCVYFKIREMDSLKHSAVHYSNNELYTSRCKSLPLRGRYQLIPQGNVAVSVTRAQTDNRLHISCTALSYPGDYEKEGDFYLDYKHSIHSYCFCLSTDRKIYISVNHGYGFGSYLDILLYDGMLNIAHNQRKKLPDNFVGYVNTIDICECCTKLFLCNYVASCVILYSLNAKLFGPVYTRQWDARMEVYDYHYAYHQNIGNLLLICGEKGIVKGLRENALKLSPIEGGDLELTEYGFPKDVIFEFLHVDCSHRIMVFIYVKSLNELLMFDYLERRIVGKFIAADGHFIVKVKTDWSGQEIFVLTEHDHSTNHMNDLTLSILFSDQVLSLKHIAKMAVFKTYSVDYLKGVNIPRNLKSEMKFLF